MHLLKNVHVFRLSQYFQIVSKNLNRYFTKLQARQMDGYRNQITFKIKVIKAKYNIFHQIENICHTYYYKPIILFQRRVNIECILNLDRYVTFVCLYILLTVAITLNLYLGIDYLYLFNETEYRYFRQVNLQITGQKTHC